MIDEEKEPTPKWARWGVDFTGLEPGDRDVTEFYRTKIGAHISIFWEKYVFSRGCQANLFQIIRKGS